MMDLINFGWELLRLKNFYDKKHSLSVGTWILLRLRGGLVLNSRPAGRQAGRLSAI